VYKAMAIKRMTCQELIMPGIKYTFLIILDYGDAK